LLRGVIVDFGHRAGGGGGEANEVLEGGGGVKVLLVAIKVVPRKSGDTLSLDFAP